MLDVKNLQVSFYTHAGEVQAVRGVDFTIEKGETVALVGESGCGKSVTAKTIMGLLPRKQSNVKEGGSICFEGKEILNHSKKEWNAFCGKKCGMVFQDALSALNPTVRVGKQVMENLDNHTDYDKKTQERLAIDILERVGIPDAKQCLKKYPTELSGGMRQRVMIASALICHPQLLIADEPTTALDVTIQAQVLELLQEMQKEMQMSILLITHDLGVVAKMANKVAVMYAGKIVEQAEVKELFRSPKHPYTWALLQSVPQIDGDKADTELKTIEGTLPSGICPPKGCAFAERCPYCMSICLEEQPQCYECGSEHKVACWLQEESADISDIAYLYKEER